MESKELIIRAIKLIEKECDPTIIRIVDGEKQLSQEMIYILQLQILLDDIEIDPIGVESMLSTVFCEMHLALYNENKQLSNALKRVYMKYEKIGEKEFLKLIVEYRKMLKEEAKEEAISKGKKKKKKNKNLKWIILILLMIILTKYLLVKQV